MRNLALLAACALLLSSCEKPSGVDAPVAKSLTEQNDPADPAAIVHRVGYIDNCTLYYIVDLNGERRYFTTCHG